ncbi:MAG: hypothetical protein AAGB15_05025 [Pseudomonadota bacterium]
MSQAVEQARAGQTVLSLGGDATCGLALGADGATERHCRWDFPYRADAAVERLAALQEAAKACLGAAPVPVEPGVNHPDSFDQHIYALEGLEISLSLKDKAALSQTFVFLRVSLISEP